MYLCGMFVRKKRNKSGSVSVQVVAKDNGKYRVVKTVGCSSDLAQVDCLYRQGQEWVRSFGGRQMSLDFNCGIDSFDQIERVLLNGPLLLLGKYYEDIGFGQIDDKTLRELVIARVSEPLSKYATTRYLRSHFGREVKPGVIYRYMDSLKGTRRELVQQISVQHTMCVLGGRIGLVFYDVTTLYFESNKEDELRSPGFSKDGKTSETQVVLGLLVSRDGYPLSYSLFNGAQFEGRTLIPVIDDFVQRFSLTDFVIVADSGLLNTKNIALLNQAGYKYVVGARIRNEAKSVQEWILGLPKADGDLHEHRKSQTVRLIVGYSTKRAAKNRLNREKGLKRLEKAYQSGRLTKENINRRGYNKFLSISKDVRVTIDRDKITEDERWDGLKGYLTNTELPAELVVEHYHGLWVVERAFRIGKGRLDMRPMFHFKTERIEAHICICFMAYKLYKELERVIRLKNIGISVDKVIDIAKTITTITIRKNNGIRETKTLFLTEEQKLIEPLF